MTIKTFRELAAAIGDGQHGCQLFVNDGNDDRRIVRIMICPWKLVAQDRTVYGISDKEKECFNQNVEEAFDVQGPYQWVLLKKPRIVLVLYDEEE